MVWTPETAEMAGINDMSPMDWDIVGRRYLRILIPLGEPRMMEAIFARIDRFQLEARVEMSMRKPLRGRLMYIRILAERCSQDIRAITDQFGIEVQEGRKTQAHTGNRKETVTGQKTGKQLRIVGDS